MPTLTNLAAERRAGPPPTSSTPLDVGGGPARLPLASLVIRALNPTDELDPLLQSYVDPPIAAHRDSIDPHRLAQFFLHRARQIVLNAITTIVEADAHPAALACWTPLPWDTRMFGFPAARLDFLLGPVEAKPLLLDAALNQARHRGIRHIIARISTNDLSTIHALEQSGFELIDELQTFSLPTAHAEDFADNIHTRLFEDSVEDSDLNQILDIARTSYIFDRFHADSAIDNTTADRINEEWLRNSCNGTAADAVVVAVDGPTVLGYATCKIDRDTREALGVSFSSIVMVATAEHARNRGVGKACTAAAIRWFRSQNVDVIQVGTQLRNTPASRLYHKCGFRNVAATLILRKLL